MAIDPRQILTVEAFGIGTLILSAVVMAGVLYLIWRWHKLAQKVSANFMAESRL